MGENAMDTSEVSSPIQHQENGTPTQPATPASSVSVAAVPAEVFIAMPVLQQHGDVSNGSVKKKIFLLSLRIKMGFGYIEFNNAAAMNEAISGMNMFDLGGQFLRASKSAQGSGSASPLPMSPVAITAPSTPPSVVSPVAPPSSPAVIQPPPPSIVQPPPPSIDFPPPPQLFQPPPPIATVPPAPVAPPTITHGVVSLSQVCCNFWQKNLKRKGLLVFYFRVRIKGIHHQIRKKRKDVWLNQKKSSNIIDYLKILVVIVDAAKAALDNRFFAGKNIRAEVYDQAMFDHNDLSG
uniref:RRM domain-containing protein n=1 Tax=Heterorhabditis bacteriophora TaxID=37862 RepID=A0A1I7WYY0_HETBA